MLSKYLSRAKISKVAKRLRDCILKVIVRTATLPYYRLFHFGTLGPIKRIATCASQSGPSGKPLRLNGLIFQWRKRKLAELHFTSIACAILAAAVIGTFSWNTVPNAYWLSSALWYCSLVLSILGLLISAQQIAVLDLLGPCHASEDLRSIKAEIRRYLPLMLTKVVTESQTEGSEISMWVPRRKMVFTWQCPIMFMSYSVCSFLAGLTIYVCTPLIRRDTWSADDNIAVVFLAVTAIASAAFMFCSFWIYHYVDLEQESENPIEMGNEASMARPFSVFS